MCESRSRVASLFVRKSELPYARPVSESDQLRTTNSLPFIMQEMDAKRSTKLPQRESAEENDRADTLSDACQVGDTDGDVPVTQSTRRHLMVDRKLRYIHSAMYYTCNKLT